MATIDEYIAEYLTDIDTFLSPRSGVQEIVAGSIPAAQVVTDPSIVSIVNQSTAQGTQEVIPLTRIEDRQILDNNTLRDDDESLSRVLSANIKENPIITAIPISQTDIDARSEAFVPPSPEEPQEASIIQSQQTPLTLPATELVVDRSEERATEQEQFFNETVRPDSEENVSSELVNSLTQDVGQTIPEGAREIIREFVQAFLDAEEQSLQSRSAIGSETELVDEQFIFDPNVSLFAAADQQYSSIADAVERESRIQQVVSGTIESSFDSFSSTESLASSGG